MTVVTFFITRQPFYSFNPDVLQSKAQIEDVRSVCEEIKEQVGKRLYTEITSSDGPYEFPDLKSMVDDYLRLKLRRNVQSWKTNQLPKIVTHTLKDDSKDEILNFLRTSNLVNNRHDKVKIVYHPDFISTSNPLFKMDYTQFVRGCHLGVFPSYYEPWGYTPLECIARGVPAVTSDLSGFGRYVNKMEKDMDESGIYVLNRLDVDFDKAANNLATYLHQFVKGTRRYRMIQRNKLEDFSEHFDWRQLTSYYDEAYEHASAN